MRLSRYFLPILRETPKEAEIVSHRLMLRAGMIRQEAAGIYAWLPLGMRVLKKIEQIVVNLSHDPQGKKMLRELYQIDGFVPASDADYNSVREAFAVAGIQLKEALQKKRS